MKLYQAIASVLDAKRTWDARGNVEWSARWQACLDHIVRNALPSGAGVDNGTQIDVDSPRGKIVLRAAFHHMDYHGMYTQWTVHKITVTPCLVHGFEIGHISGRNVNYIKDYLAGLYGEALRAEYVWHGTPEIICRAE